MKIDPRENLTKIKSRLSWLHDVSQGILYCHPSGFHFVVVDKVKTFIRLGYLDKNLKTSYVQSVLDLANPFHLVSPSTQVMLLALLWQNNPEKVYLAGFGAGRLPFILNYWFPNAVIEGTDIEPTTPEIAKIFFGIEFSDNLTLIIQDGRNYLENQEPQKLYDLIVIDVALGNGYTPYRLVTQKFYQLCKRHLSSHGVAIFNYLPGDDFIPDKLTTLQSVFDTTYVCPTSGNNTIVFAADIPSLTAEELVSRAKLFEENYKPSFSLLDCTQRIYKGEDFLNKHVDRLSPKSLLLDDDPPAKYFDNLPPLKPLTGHVGENAFCPCGSGKYFVACHAEP